MQIEQKHHAQCATDRHARQQAQQLRLVHVLPRLQQVAKRCDKIQQHQQWDDLRQRHEQDQQRPRHQCGAKSRDTEHDIGHDNAQADHQPIHTTKRPLAHQFNRVHGSFLARDDLHFSQRREMRLISSKPSTHLEKA